MIWSFTFKSQGFCVDSFLVPASLLFSFFLCPNLVLFLYCTVFVFFRSYIMSFRSNITTSRIPYTSMIHPPFFISPFPLLPDEFSLSFAFFSLVVCYHNRSNFHPHISVYLLSLLMKNQYHSSAILSNRYGICL